MTCLVLAAVLLAACDGPEQREAAHFQRGQAFFESGNYSKARLEFRNVLQINSRNVEGRYALALVSEAEGNLQQAFVDFQLAIEQKPDHLPSLIKVGQYYLLGNRLDDAMEVGSSIVALSPGNADGHALRGAVYLRRDDLPAARREIGLALQSDPASVAAISAQVGLQRKDGRIDLALTTLADAVKTHPGEAGLRLLQVELLVEQGDLDEALGVYQDLIASDPDNLEYKTNFARLLLKQDRKDEAEAFLRGVAEAAASTPRPKLLLVDFLYSQRGFAPAETALLGFVQQYPDEPAYRFSLAEVYLKQEDGAQAIRVYREIIALDKTGPKGLIARAALAQVLMAQGDKDAARALIAEVLKIDPLSTEALFLRARDRLEQGDNQGSIANLRTLLRERPELADGRAMLAEAHLRNGEPTLAIEALRTLLEFSPENLAVQVELARQLARTGESASALAILREALARVPDDPAALRVEAEIYAQQKNWPALITTATTMIRQSPDKALSYYVRGQTYLVQRRFAEAAADFAEVVRLEPDALDPMVGLVQTYLGRDQGKEAEAMLQKRLADEPDNAAWHNLLGELYLATDKADLAEAAFRAAIKVRKDHGPAYGNLARMAARAGELDRAIQIYKEGLAEAPGDEGLSLSLAEAHILSKDYTAAMDVYEAMLTRKSDLPVVANNLAALIADFAPDDKAKLARALELARPFDTMKDPFFLDTLGWVHFRLGNLQQALSYLEQAVTKAPDSPQLNYHLGMAYRAAGQVAKARSALNLAIVDGADYPGVQIARAALADM